MCQDEIEKEIMNRCLLRNFVIDLGLLLDKGLFSGETFKRIYAQGGEI